MYLQSHSFIHSFIFPILIIVKTGCISERLGIFQNFQKPGSLQLRLAELEALGMLLWLFLLKSFRCF